MVQEWELPILEARLAKAREEHKDGKLLKSKLASLEEDTAKVLCLAIEKAVSFADPSRDTGQLPNVIRSRKALCLGYSQLFFVLGNSVGLSVKVIDVLELASGPVPFGESHVACLVELADDQTIFVDLTRNLRYYSLITASFQFKETYEKVGVNWEVKNRHNLFGLYRKIQVLDERGLTALIYAGQLSVLCKKGDISHASSRHRTLLA